MVLVVFKDVWTHDFDKPIFSGFPIPHNLQYTTMLYARYNYLFCTQFYIYRRFGIGILYPFDSFLPSINPILLG